MVLVVVVGFRIAEVEGVTTAETGLRIAEVEGATPAEGTVDGLHAVDVAMGVERSGIGIRVAFSVVILAFFETRIQCCSCPRALASTPPARLESTERSGKKPSRTDFDNACLFSRRGHLPGSGINSEEGTEADSEASLRPSGW